MSNDNGTKENQDAAQDILDAIQRQDGVLSDSAALSKKHEGVIMTTITGIADDKDYRQILKRGNWRSYEEMDLYANALNCCLYVGAVMAFRSLLDRITIHSAGLDKDGERMALRSLAHLPESSPGSWLKGKMGGKSGDETIKREKESDVA